MRRPWDAIAWWEIRRIPFNFVLLLAGMVSIVAIETIGSHFVRPGEDVVEPPALLLGIVLYALGANACYTLGWISELLWSAGETGKTRSLRGGIFLKGLLLSTLITLLPGLIFFFLGMIKGFHHGQ